MVNVSCINACMQNLKAYKYYENDGTVCKRILILNYRPKLSMMQAISCLCETLAGIHLWECSV